MKEGKRFKIISVLKTEKTTFGCEGCYFNTSGGCSFMETDGIVDADCTGVIFKQVESKQIIL